VIDICNSPNSLDQPSVHEAGHATMAVIQKRHCEGTFVELADEGRVFWRTITENVGLTKESYLIDAAATAAELLVFGQVISEPIGDKRDFSLPGAPSWEATVAEAQSILTPFVDAIRRIAAAVQRVCANMPLTSIPESTIDGLKLRQVLSTDEIYRAFHGC